MDGDEDRQRLLADGLVAASASLGVELVADAAPLPGSDRAVVVRARRSDTGATVVVKVFDPARSGEGWVREAAALDYLTGRGTSAPELLAVVDESAVVVLEDLGRGGSLATSLLGKDPAAAAGDLVAWAEALADLHAATWDDDEGFAAALARHAGPLGADTDTVPGLLADAGGRLRAAADRWDLPFDDAVTRELLALPERLHPRVSALSPSDACPDNNLAGPAGLRLFDFEGATASHPAWDVAYLSVPWPTCWCAWDLPADAVDRARRAWRRRLAQRLPVSGRRAVDLTALDDAVALASAGWALVTAGWFLGRAEADAHVGPDTATAPPARALVRHRLALVVRSDRPELPAGTALARALGEALDRRWAVVPLALAPAFRSAAG